VAVVLLLASASLRRPDAGVVLHEVARGDLEVWTVYEGAVQARSVRGVSSQLAGGATVVELAAEGGQVKAGAPLARLDAAALERDLVRLGGERALARAEAESLARARIPLEQRELEMRLLQARADLQDAEDALRDLNELVAEGLIPQQDAAQQEKRNLLLRAAVENLEEQQRLTRDYLHPAALERAEALREAADRAWELAQRQMEQSVIAAPADGTVVYPAMAVGSEFRPVRIGDTVYKNQVFLTLPDMADLIVTLDVPEHELGLVGEGRPAWIEPVAFPGMSLTGMVESVGTMAGTRPDRPGRQKYFRVVVRLEGADPMLRSGMSCRVRVLSHAVKDRPLVPRAALVWEEGRPQVRVWRDGAARLEAVVLAAAGPEWVAVAEGLVEGQRIVRP
jgi:multidrug resistance efflux pump